MSFLLPLLGAVAGPLASAALGGGGGGGAPAQPGVASRGSSDFAPVTNVNAVGAPDLKGIGDLINSINTENNTTASMFGYLPANASGNFTSAINLPTILVVGGGIFLILYLLKKHK